MYSESDLLPLSGLQHLAYCERQWALIHIEQQWAENRLTAEGRQMHSRAHEHREERRKALHISRGVAVRSLRLGLSGMVDVVEFHSVPDGTSQPFPIEYKHGRPKPGPYDEIQLCAQALCLEEMLAARVPRGAIFYGQPRHRMEVLFDDSLRAETEALAGRMHALYRTRSTPAAVYEPQKCDRCSLIQICLPQSAGKRRPVQSYIRRSLSAAEEIA